MCFCWLVSMHPFWMPTQLNDVITVKSRQRMLPCILYSVLIVYVLNELPAVASSFERWENEVAGVNMIIPSQPIINQFIDNIAATPTPTTSCLSCPTALPTCQPACKPDFQICRVTPNSCLACATANCVTKPGCVTCSGGMAISNDSVNAFMQDDNESMMPCDCKPGQLCEQIPRTCGSCPAVICIDPPPNQPCLFCQAPYQCIVRPDPECFGTTRCKNLMSCLDPAEDCAQCQNLPVPDCSCKKAKDCFYVPQTCDYCAYYDCKKGKHYRRIKSSP